MQPVNPILERMRSGRPALGLTARLVSSIEIVRIARATGHHFLRIDTQHAAFDLETMAGIAGAGLLADFGTLVRAQRRDDPTVAMALDLGIGGVVFPDIENVEQARLAASLARFPPLGQRSYGGSYPHFDYRSVPVGEATSALDSFTLVGCMVESGSGVENAAAIASVPCVDLIHLGMSDLLISLGHPGEYDHPALWEALDRLVSIGAETGVFVGCGGAPSVEHQAEAIRRGALLVTTKADVNFLSAAATTWVADLTELVGQI
jgi:2-keto-3-deoxy-L-rhamnonate aldolase RhmA